MNFISSFWSYVFTRCHINWKQDESHQSSNRLWAIWPDEPWEKCRFQCWVHKSAVLSLHGKRTARIYCSSVWHETSQSEVYAHTQRAHAYSSGFGVDLFTDVLMAVLATPCLKVSESVAVTETMITKYRTLYLWRRRMPQGQKSQIYNPSNKAEENSLVLTALLPGKLTTRSRGLMLIFIFLLLSHTDSFPPWLGGNHTAQADMTLV